MTYHWTFAVAVAAAAAWTGKDGMTRSVVEEEKCRGNPGATGPSCATANYVVYADCCLPYWFFLFVGMVYNRV